MSTANASVHHDDAADSTAAAVIAGVLFPVAIYGAFALHLGLWAGAGFCVIVPSVIGSTIAAAINAARD